MGRLLIKCPESEKMIPTGMEMDQRSFKGSTLQNNSVLCPECGKTHNWDRDDVIFVDKEE